MRTRRHSLLLIALLLAIVLPNLLILPADGRGGDAYRARWTAPRRIAPGELVEYPDVAVDPQGLAWVSWIGLHRGHEQVFVRTYRGLETGTPKVVGAKQGLQYWPRVIAAGDQVWVVWSIKRTEDQGRANPWKLVAREISGPVPGPIEVLSSSSEDALRPALGLDSEGRPWVAWESRRGKTFRVMARPLTPSHGRPAAVEVASRGELNLRPSLTAAPEGGLYVVWDRYQKGRYDIMARRLDGRLHRPIRISDENAANLGAYATTDPVHGRVIIVYATNSDLAGGQQVGKMLRVKVLEKGKLFDLAGGHPPPLGTAPGRIDSLEFPTAAVDPEGRFWVFARRGQGWVVYRYEGSRWYQPIDLSRLGWGGRGRMMRLAYSPQGFHLVARRLHLLAHQLFVPSSLPARQMNLKPARAIEEEPAEAAPISVDGKVPSHEKTDPAPGQRPEGLLDRVTGWLAHPLFGPEHAEDRLRVDHPLPSDLPINPAIIEGSPLGSQLNLPSNQDIVSIAESSAFDVSPPDPEPSQDLQNDSMEDLWPNPHDPGASGAPDVSLPAPSLENREATPPPMELLMMTDGVGAPRPALPSATYVGSADPEVGPLPDPSPPGIFFGDLHTHSWMSDGAGDADEVYTRSRDRYGYDFVALTDHDVENGNILLPSEWAYLILMANFFNQPHRFVTFIAYEWTSPAYPRGAGHRNIYFPDEGPLFNSASDAPDTKTLFELTKEFGALAVPHHIGWTGTDWHNHDPEVQRAVEIVSVHGAFEAPGNEPIPARAELSGMFVRDGLMRGLRFGLIGGSDGHGFSWHYGVSRKEDVWRTGLTGIHVKSLERAVLHSALMSRLSFATSGAGMAVWFYADSAPMGSEIEVDEPPEFDIKVQGTHPLRDVYMIRDGEVLEQFPGDGKKFEISLKDNPTPGDHFYYIRAVQKNGEVAWSSPIWVNLKPRIIMGPPDP